METLYLLMVFIVSLCFFRSRQKSRKLPPGAPSLPVLGSLPWLLWSGKHTFEFISDDREKYGSISTLQLPFFNLISLNEPQLMRKVLNMEECSGRPSETLAWMKCWGKPLGLVLPDYGPFWKDQKRFVMKRLRDFGFGRKSEESIQEEASLVVADILDEHEKNSENFQIKHQFNLPVLNVLWKMVANKTFHKDSLEGNRFVEILEVIFGSQLSPLGKTLRIIFTESMSPFRSVPAVREAAGAKLAEAGGAWGQLETSRASWGSLQSQRRRHHWALVCGAC